MAYLIKSLGIRYKGDMIEVSSNKKEYILELINKMPNEIINDKKESHNEVLNNDNDYKINKEHKILQCKKYINNYRCYVLNKYSYNTIEYNSEFIYLLNTIVIDIKHNISVYNKYPKWIKKLIY